MLRGRGAALPDTPARFALGDPLAVHGVGVPDPRTARLRGVRHRPRAAQGVAQALGRFDVRRGARRQRARIASAGLLAQPARGAPLRAARGGGRVRRRPRRHHAGAPAARRQRRDAAGERHGDVPRDAGGDPRRPPPHPHPLVHHRRGRRRPAHPRRLRRTGAGRGEGPRDVRRLRVAAGEAPALLPPLRRHPRDAGGGVLAREPPQAAGANQPAQPPQALRRGRRERLHRGHQPAQGPSGRLRPPGDSRLPLPHPRPARERAAVHLPARLVLHDGRIARGAARRSVLRPERRHRGSRYPPAS